MKFAVIFVISSVALAIVNGQPQQAKAEADATPTREDVRMILEGRINDTKVTCDDFSVVCNEFKRSDPNDHLATYALEECNTLFRKYLCDGKKYGEGFEEVYNEYVKAWHDVRETH